MAKRSGHTSSRQHLHARESMGNNIVVYGLPTKPGRSDVDAVVELCIINFGYAPRVTRVTRLGRAVPNKMQPLLVVCGEGDGKLLLSLAKQLRRSNDEYVKHNVFISAQLTRAERQAAYEARCRRRQQNDARPNNNTAGRQGPRSAQAPSKPGLPPPPAAAAIHPLATSTQSSVAVNTAGIHAVTTAAAVSGPTVGGPSSGRGKASTKVAPAAATSVDRPASADSLGPFKAAVAAFAAVRQAATDFTSSIGQKPAIEQSSQLRPTAAVFCSSAAAVPTVAGAASTVNSSSAAATAAVGCSAASATGTAQ